MVPGVAADWMADRVCGRQECCRRAACPWVFAGDPVAGLPEGDLVSELGCEGVEGGRHPQGFGREHVEVEHGLSVGQGQL